MALNSIINIIMENSIIVSLICVLTGLYIIRLKKSYAEFPPGPWGFPLCGYLPLFSKLPYKDFVKMSKKYGDVFSITIGTRLTIVLNHYEIIKEAFVKYGDIYAGKPTEGLPAEFGDNKCIFVTEGDIWKVQRRFILNTFREFGLGRSSIERHIQEEAKSITDEVIRSLNKPVDMKALISLATINFLSAFIFGKKFTQDDKDVFDAVNVLNDISSDVSPFSLLDAFPITQKLIKLAPMFSQYLKLKKKLYEFTDEKIESHRKTFDTNNFRDMIDVYLSKQKEIEPDNTDTNLNIYTEDYMRTNIMFLFVAGMDTTSGTLTWAFKLLALYPDIQSKIQQEIDDVIGSDRLPEMKDKLKMPFTESTLLEVHRFISYLPLTFYHRTTEEANLGGYRIRKHTLVLANLWSVHNDPRIWKNPSEFNPERFLDKDGKISNLRDYVISFSVGKRSCLGETLARMELFLFLVTLLQKLTFTTTEDKSFESLKLPFHRLNSCKLNVIVRQKP